ncbi:amidohydrolase [Virgibacillus sp. MSP4-1]|uniref:amidohydrolase n=1 Tax=Virgibacillus sp. MSP4-1 TaxID=2700081 RepID=UPI0003A8A4F9|nr:amidohydrolase [Virgibacillus sp. MSP4-1]QHS23025.1 amidohydrolase [Virgibacillus sp. MSP4-1]
MGKLWFGGTIYTMHGPGETVEAVFTQQGQIVDTGTKEYLENLYKSQITDKHNLKGHVMYPGFTDSHLHIIGHGERLLQLDLAYAKSPEEVLELIQRKSEELPEEQWLIGEGFNENSWNDSRIIHRYELDEICPDRPVMLTRICRHAIIANTKAMEIAGITAQTPEPDGGIIDRDQQGELTGFFKDTAQELIKSHIPEVTTGYLEKAIHAAVEDLVRHGIVGGHSEDLNYYGGFKRTYDSFARTIDGERHKFRANLLVHNGVIEEMDENHLSFSQGTDWIELGAMKIFADGAFGGRTAWLSEPYADQSDEYGVQIYSEEHMKQLMKKAREREMPVAVHAIGDQAVEMVMDMIEQFPPSEGVRDRIIHAQLVNPALIERMSALNIIVDIQPTFVASDFPWVLERIGEERMPYAYPWKSFLEAGIACAGGSDAPIEEIDPLKGISAAVNRISTLNGQVYGEQQCLTPFEAVSLYTTGAAYAIGKENEQGKIEPGFTADFTVLDKDLFSINSKEIPNAKVQQTIIDETVVYERRE